jgi:hypothetical protein
MSNELTYNGLQERIIESIASLSYFNNDTKEVLKNIQINVGAYSGSLEAAEIKYKIISEMKDDAIAATKIRTVIGEAAEKLKISIVTPV